MNLIFLRHGKAEDFADRDENRDLTPEGIEELRVILPVAARMLPTPTQIISSPYLRARKTAALAEELIAPNLPIELTDLLTPGSTPAAFLDELHSFSTPTLLAVTHQPFVSRCISFFVTGRESADVSVPRGGLAWIELTGRSGRLRSLLRPEQLKGLRRE